MKIRFEELDALENVVAPPFITIIGRGGAGVPVHKIETVIEFNSETAKKIFRQGLINNQVIKTLVDESKIKSLIILDNGEIHPSTFHFITIRKRCAPYITFLTAIGCEAGGINIDKINLIVNCKFDNSSQILSGVLDKYTYIPTYDDGERTKSLIITDSHRVYPCTFNFATLSKRIHQMRGDIEKEEDDESEEQEEVINSVEKNNDEIEEEDEDVDNHYYFGNPFFR